jgi:hypothetical protein
VRYAQDATKRPHSRPAGGGSCDEMTDPPPASTSAQAGSPRRLRTIGLQPRQDRSTVLCTLAGELPAAILAQPLGTRINIAVAWAATAQAMVAQARRVAITGLPRSARRQFRSCGAVRRSRRWAV